jgi:hypothetical protein
MSYINNAHIQLLVAIRTKKQSEFKAIRFTELVKKKKITLWKRKNRNLKSRNYGESIRRITVN